jgi:ADP-heptose:LPS heptosyltransferase
MNFDTFITKNYQEIKSICKKIDRVNYEDLCHDVIIKLRNEPNFINAIENNKYKAYIWKVAKNECIISLITLNPIYLGMPLFYKLLQKQL